MIRHVSIKDFVCYASKIFLMFLIWGVSLKLTPYIVRLLHSLRFNFQMHASVVAPLGENGNKNTSLNTFLLLCLLIKMFNWYVSTQRHI